jgi:hypothetical protein
VKAVALALCGVYFLDHGHALWGLACIAIALVCD